MRFLCFLFFVARLSAQPAQLAGVINHYAAVTAFDTCTGALSVTDTTGFRPGGAILILQVQGAQIAAGNNDTYGQMQNLSTAGRYERAIVDSVSATAIFLKTHWIYAYNLSGRVQVVTIPRFTDAVVTDTVRARPWNGSTGGVLALEVTGTLTLNAPLSADGAGFRGGAPYFVADNGCNFFAPQFLYYYALGNWRGGYKGEGLALPAAGKELGRGPQATGGGGGNDHNSGGGGGGQLSDGGQGGANNEPNPLGCSGLFPGIGGYGIADTTNRVFFGGGGGAGHANNGLTTGGAAGGGLILVQAGNITGAQAVLSANGLAAGTGDGDGGGGGGAGGTIWLQATTADTNLVVSADGGRGGDTMNNGGVRCAGPGGGGSGGRILTDLPLAAPPGGQPGVITNSAYGCNGTSANAAPGETGFLQALPVVPQGTVPFLPVVTLQPLSVSVCTGANAGFVVGTNAGDWSYQWQVFNAGLWQNLQGAQSDSLLLTGLGAGQDSTRYRVVVIASGCTQAISAEALLRVLTLPTAGFATLVDGTTVIFSNQSTAATDYFWDFGDGSYSTLAAPEHTYAEEGIYSVTLAVGNACDTAVITQVIPVLALPMAGFFVADTLEDCLSAAVTFQNLSSANVLGWQWSFPGGDPAFSTASEPTVTYTASGTYTAQLIVSNLAGQDTAVHTFEVRVATLPTADFDFVPLPGGVVAFTNLSPTDAVFTWDFGDGSPAVASRDATHQYTASGVYVVTLSASNACGGAVLQQNITVTVAGTTTFTAVHPGRVQVSPNPAGEYLNIDCNAVGARPTAIRIFEATGRLWFQQKDGAGLSTRLPLAGWPSGTYTLVVEFERGRVVRTFVH